ncbi:hypothetical protein BS47DRAFT_1066652 [Hydnum rufescens UP504]|uniref:Uncharacterized protein n=1 Tax=Hydnum rufescens UP504 TaxID=1448309 RepID=A0A9P6AUV9_9AGAM|nr:hypothetical protein BS47DRAFT_1066652 [Hydnum rufescens UP504]
MGNRSTLSTTRAGIPPAPSSRSRLPIPAPSYSANDPALISKDTRVCPTHKTLRYPLRTRCEGCSLRRPRASYSFSSEDRRELAEKFFWREGRPQTKGLHVGRKRQHGVDPHQIKIRGPGMTRTLHMRRHAEHQITGRFEVRIQSLEILLTAADKLLL